MRKRTAAIAILSVSLLTFLGCGQHSATPAMSSDDVPPGPFGGYLPSKAEPRPDDSRQANPSVTPFGNRIPAGTMIAVRLSDPISSATARSDDAFEGILEESITMDGQTVLERGARVRGKVVEAGSKRSTHAPGYLRLALTEISIDGHLRAVRTYTSFFKGAGTLRRSMISAFPGERLVSDTAVLGRSSQVDGGLDSDFSRTPKAQDVQLGTDRRLSFHLLDPLSLPSP